MQFCFIIQIKAWIHHYYVLFFVLRVRFHISKRKHSSRMKRVNDWQTPVKTLPFLAVVNKKVFQSKANRMLGNRSGDGPQVNKFEQVGGGYHVTYHMRTPFYEQTEWQTDRRTTKNITFPETTYADGTCASGKENSSSRSQIFTNSNKNLKSPWITMCWSLFFVWVFIFWDAYRLLADHTCAVGVVECWLSQVPCPDRGVWIATPKRDLVLYIEKP